MLLNLKQYTPVEVALYAASLGFYVFPADPATKRPFIKAWQDNASRDAEVIQTMWSKYPVAMIAVVTGHKSGCFVVDVDVKDNQNAYELFEKFANSVGGLPETFTIRTPSGGLHKYYKMPEELDLRNSAKKLGDGIDIRANGGYVIFAGSVRSDGKAYEIVSGGACND